MKKYKVTGRAAKFSSGRVKLSVDQAASRIHNLKSLGDGVFEIVNPIEFKNGEVFGHDGEVPKVMASVVKEKGKKLTESDSGSDSGGKGADTGGNSSEPPAKLSATALKKHNKLVLFGMLPDDHGLDFEKNTKADMIKAILAA